MMPHMRTPLPSDTYDILKFVVDQTQCKPGWSFSLVDEDGAKRLIITIDGYDNYDPRRRLKVNHVQPVPAAVTYNEKMWRRWIFEQCMRTMVHEIGESLQFGGVRPFAPMHGPGEDPYTVHEWRPETDALTTQDGSLRDGPV